MAACPTSPPPSRQEEGEGSRGGGIAGCRQPLFEGPFQKTCAQPLLLNGSACVTWPPLAAGSLGNGHTAAPSHGGVVGRGKAGPRWTGDPVTDESGSFVPHSRIPFSEQIVAEHPRCAPMLQVLEPGVNAPALVALSFQRGITPRKGRCCRACISWGDASPLGTLLSHPAGPATPFAPPTWARGLSPRPGRCLPPGEPSWQGSGVFRGKPSFPKLAGSGTHTPQWGRPFIGVWRGPGHFSWAGCGHPLVTGRCVQKGSHWPKVQHKSSPRSLLMAAVSLWDEPTAAFQAAKTQPSPLPLQDSAGSCP